MFLNGSSLQSTGRMQQCVCAFCSFQQYVLGVEAPIDTQNCLGISHGHIPFGEGWNPSMHPLACTYPLSPFKWMGASTSCVENAVILGCCPFWWTALITQSNGLYCHLACWCNCKPRGFNQSIAIVRPHQPWPVVDNQKLSCSVIK